MCTKNIKGFNFCWCGYFLSTLHYFTMPHDSSGSTKNQDNEK